MPTYQTTITSRAEDIEVDIRIVDALGADYWECDTAGPFGSTKGSARSLASTNAYLELKVGQLNLNDWKGAAVKGRGSVIENTGAFPDGEIDWEVTSIEH